MLLCVVMSDLGDVRGATITKTDMFTNMPLAAVHEAEQLRERCMTLTLDSLARKL